MCYILTYLKQQLINESPGIKQLFHQLPSVALYSNNDNKKGSFHFLIYYIELIKNFNCLSTATSLGTRVFPSYFPKISRSRDNIFKRCRKKKLNNDHYWWDSND